MVAKWWPGLAILEALLFFTWGIGRRKAMSAVDAKKSPSTSPPDRETP